MNYARISLFVGVWLLVGNTVFAQSTPSGQKPDLNIDVSNLTSQEGYALPWRPIMERDITWKKRVWRTIDLQVNENEIFSTGRLGEKLVEGVMKGKCKAYSGTDERFTKLLTKDELMGLACGKVDTQEVFDPAIQRKVTRYVTHDLNTEKITKYRIKEDWLYLEKEDKIVVRIVGIAPVREVKAADGGITERELCWFYYPDTRDFLAQSKLSVSSRGVVSNNWDELLEHRQFASRVDKEVLQPRQITEQWRVKYKK